MEPQEILKEIKDTGMATNTFWYIYSLVITGLLVTLIVAIIILVKGFLTRFLNDMKATHASFSNSISLITETNNELKIIVKLHEQELKNHKEDIDELKRRKR